MTRAWALSLLALVFVLFVSALAYSWGGPQSLPVADAVGYITAGENLVRTGHYIGAFGVVDTWFPPVYPALIGLSSEVSSLPAHDLARLIAAIAGALTIGMTYQIGARHVSRPVGLIAALLLGVNWTHQLLSSSALSETTATVLAWAGIAAWLRAHEQTPPRVGACAAAGLFLGLSFLTRPEALLFVPFLLLGSLIAFHRDALRGSLAMALACALIIAPYVIWLSAMTGHLTLTDKTAVVLAAGRSEYYGIAREVIDPVTLTLTYATNRPAPLDEAARYVHNLERIGAGYALIFGVVATPLILLCLAGVAAVRRKPLLLLALLVPFVYLPVMARYDVYERYLHLTLPAIALLAAAGVEAAAWRIRQARPVERRIAFATLCLVIAAISVENGTRLARWSGPHLTAQGALLRDAGLELSRLSRHGVAYDVGATVGYYGHQLRGRMTPDPLPLLEAYLVRHHAPGDDVFVVVSSFDSAQVHPSIRTAAMRPPDGWSQVVSVGNDGDYVKVFRVDLERLRHRPDLAGQAPHAGSEDPAYRWRARSAAG